MNEYLIGLDGTIKLLLPISFGLLYWLGGRHNNWLRRFAAPIPLIVYCMYMFGNVCIMSYALYAITLSVGYGENSRLYKMCNGNQYLIRGICGLMYGVASFGMFLATGNYTLFLIQIALAIICNILFAVILKITAAKQENLIGSSSVLLVPWFKI